MSLLAQVCCLVPKEHLIWMEECYLHCRQKGLQLAIDMVREEKMILFI